MCGIAGFLGGSVFSRENVASSILNKMANAIASRGPDDFGEYVDISQSVGLAHRRLSIVELSPSGHQPMSSLSGRYVIVYNGEIYNHQELRRQMVDQGQDIPWRGQSDTETILSGFDLWGIEATIKRCIGMFAFAVWDKKNRSLTLGRDRIGEKPLYYGWSGQGGDAFFVFGSELKALKAHPGFRAEVQRDALSLLLRHNYIPAPYSIYRGINKLVPGTLLTVSLLCREPHIRQYWSLEETSVAARLNPLTSSVEAVDELEALLKTVVAQQMMADVPLGAFLSGGVDSSTIVALMQSQSRMPVRTFTIGFHEQGYNEAEYAKAVANHLGTHHTELYVTPRQAMEVIPRLPLLYDEPFSDSSQIPTFLVSQLAGQHVTVSLSGDAGDELFCGYNRYLAASSMWRKLNMIPLPVRKLMRSGITALSPRTWNHLTSFLSSSHPNTNWGDKIHKGASVLASSSIDQLYMGLVSHWSDPASVVIGASEPATLLSGNAPRLSGFNPIERMMALDMMTYLPDDILAKVDRAAMGVSLETRVPFLDHRVIEFAWRMPWQMKQRNGQGKWALRQVLYRHVPQKLIDRPKVGFGIPLDSWLRGPLRSWGEELLDPAKLKVEGYFQVEPIRQKWKEHLSGQRNWAYHLWDILMFQAWLGEHSQ